MLGGQLLPGSRWPLHRSSSVATPNRSTRKCFNVAGCFLLRLLFCALPRSSVSFAGGCFRQVQNSPPASRCRARCERVQRTHCGGWLGYWRPEASLPLATSGGIVCRHGVFVAALLRDDKVTPPGFIGIFLACVFLELCHLYRLCNRYGCPRRRLVRCPVAM